MKKIILILLLILPSITTAQVDKIKKSQYVSEWLDKINSAIAEVNIATNKDLKQYAIWNATESWYSVYLDSANGNDANIGNSWAQAKKTYAGVLSIVNNRDFGNKDVRIFIKPGTYDAGTMAGVKGNVILTFVGRWANTPGSHNPTNDWYRAVRNDYAFGDTIPGCVQKPIVFDGVMTFERVWRVVITAAHPTSDYTPGGWNQPPGTFPGYAAFVFRGSLFFNEIDDVDDDCGIWTVAPKPNTWIWWGAINLWNVGAFVNGGLIAKIDSANAGSYAANHSSWWGGVIATNRTAGIQLKGNWLTYYDLDGNIINKSWQISGYRQFFSCNGPVKILSTKRGTTARSVFDFGTRLEYSKGYLTGADTMLTIRLNNTAVADVYYRNGPATVPSERINYSVSFPLAPPGDIMLYNRATNTSTKYNPAIYAIKDSANQVITPDIYRMKIVDSLALSKTYIADVVTGSAKLRNIATIGTGDSVQVALSDAMPTDVFVVSYVGKYTTSGDGETAPSAAVIRSGYVTLYGVNGRNVNYIRIK